MQTLNTDYDRVQMLRVRTPEGVCFSFRLASPVMRMVALLIDWSIIMTAWSLVAGGLSMLAVISKDFAGMVGVIGYFVLSQGYHMASEYLWRGQTLGKRVMKLRVVDAQGMRLSFPQIAMRNLLRFVDVLPGAYLVGGTASFFNTRAQRLGDLAAGTVVIWEPPLEKPDLKLFQLGKYNSLKAHSAVVARLRHAVSPALAQVAWQTLERRDQLSPEARLKLFAEQAEVFREIAKLPQELSEGLSDEQFVRNVVEVLF